MKSSNGKFLKEMAEKGGKFSMETKLIFFPYALGFIFAHFLHPVDNKVKFQYNSVYQLTVQSSLTPECATAVLVHSP